MNQAQKAGKHTITMLPYRWKELREFADGLSVSAFIWRLLVLYKTNPVSFTGLTRHKLIQAANKYSGGSVEVLINSALEIAEASGEEKFKQEVARQRQLVQKERNRFL